MGRISDTREEINTLVREGKVEFRHFIISLEGIGSWSHDLGAEVSIHFLTVDCKTSK